MASSITVPKLSDIGTYPPALAAALITVATAAKTDIDASVGSGAMLAPVANIAALTATDITSVQNGTLCLVLADNTGAMSVWRYHSTSTATESTKFFVAAPDSGAGAWLNTSREVAIKPAVAFTTTDAAVLFTVPTGARLHPRKAWWDITTSFAGGSSSAIGLSTSVSGFSTKGDLLGGASGDLAATLVSTNTRMVGTVGATLTSTSRLIMIAADTVKFDRITDVYTSGAGFGRVLFDVLANLGA